MRNGKWLRLLAYVTGSVNQELLLRNEYLAAENRILQAKLPSRLRLCNPERATLAEIGKRLGRKALREVACVAKPDTILAWYRRLVAKSLMVQNTGSIGRRENDSASGQKSEFERVCRTMGSLASNRSVPQRASAQSLG
jgi:hypothetical protein